MEAHLQDGRCQTLSDPDLVSAPPPGYVLCRLDEVGDVGTKGFTFGSGRERFEMFIVRRDGEVFGYINKCPHARTPLDWTPHQFLTRDRANLLCATHGARFRIEDGYCVAGPCPGASLTPVPVAIENDDIVIAGAIDL